MTGSEWTCARCGVIVTFMPGAIDSFELPSNWDRLDGVAYCLGCLRKLAGAARAGALGDQGTAAERLRADAEGRIEFELRRVPDRANTRVARACGTNVALVRQVRERLGAYPTRPI